MNKTELVETIAQRTDISKKDVQTVLDTFEDIAGDVVAKGKEALTIPGFLKFEQTHRAARTGRNPQTGETIQVAGRQRGQGHRGRQAQGTGQVRQVIAGPPPVVRRAALPGCQAGTGPLGAVPSGVVGPLARTAPRSVADLVSRHGSAQRR